HQGQGSASEFYRQSVLGRLDGFNYWGSAVGVMPTLDFPAVRRFLLGLLAECPSDQWLSTSALVEHLKKHHRSFLIPAKPRFKNEHDARSGRYGNFHESKDAWGREIDIHESDADGFERVEGRYVERFLEVFRWCSAMWTWRMRGSPQTPFIPRWAVCRPSASAIACAAPSRGASSNRGSPCLPTSTSMWLRK